MRATPIAAGIVSAALLVLGCGKSPEQIELERHAGVGKWEKALPPVPQSPAPVSPACVELVDAATDANLIIGTAGFTDRVGNVLVDPAWTQWSFQDQKQVAECMGHVVGESQDRTVNLRFFNQASGVTYGVLENGHYRVPE